MKRIISLVLAAALLLSMTSLLSACGGSGETITVYNWGEYIDESVLDDFEAETGIKVNYKTFDTNEALYSTLKTGGSNIDVIITSDYMVGRLIRENMVQKLDYSTLSNFSKVNDALKNLNYDPTNEYTVPYMWGTVGVIYNTAMITDPVDSWGALFDPAYTGQIAMIDNSRDALAIALLYLGYSVNTTDEKQLTEAYDLLSAQKPLVQAYVMDQIFDKMEAGEAAISTYYAGDYLTMKEQNPDLAFSWPKEGTTWFVDAMCVPATSTKLESAEKFIDFMTSTDICVRNMDQTGYASANTEACDEYAADLDPEAAAIMFPDAAFLAGCEMFENLPEETLALYDNLWTQLKS